MSKDDFDTPPPKKIFVYPTNWVLNFEEDEGYYYYNRTLGIKGVRSPIDLSLFKNWKIQINQYCIIKLDNEGDPYYNCINKGEKTISRTPPVNMKNLFPYGIELLLTAPFFNKLDKFKKVEVLEVKGEVKGEVKVKNELQSYLQALANGVHCDENTPCDGDHECDLEQSKCIPKSDTSYYEDIKRHENDGTFFVGKTSTIQKLIDSIAARKGKKDAEDATEEEKKAAKQKRKDEKAAAKKQEQDAEDAAEEEKKAAKKKRKDEKAAKEQDATSSKKKQKDVEDSDLDMEDNLDQDSDNLTELQEALIKCLMPSV